MQTYPGGAPGHKGQYWHQNQGWQGSPDIHAGLGVQGGHPAEGLGDHGDTHGGEQEREAHLFTILIRQIIKPHLACNCQNPTHNEIQLMSYKLLEY